jgi:hypothetical protein
VENIGASIGQDRAKSADRRRYRSFSLFNPEEMV